MAEAGVNKLKEKDDEFMREAGIIKSITAVVGNLLKIMRTYLILTYMQNGV